MLENRPGERDKEKHSYHVGNDTLSITITTDNSNIYYQIKCWGNYFYTTKVPSSDTEEKENEIGSDDAPKPAKRKIFMDWNKGR